MKTRYFTCYSIFKPVKCFGVIKIVEDDIKPFKNIYDNREGYYWENGDWIRDDYRACGNAFGENMDWFEASEEEAKKAIEELNAKRG